MTQNRRIGRQIEELAPSVAKGFDEVYRRTSAQTEDVKRQLGEVEIRVAEQLDQIGGEERRVTILEDRVRQLATKIGMTFN